MSIFIIIRGTYSHTFLSNVGFHNIHPFITKEKKIILPYVGFKWKIETCTIILHSFGDSLFGPFRETVDRYHTWRRHLLPLDIKRFIMYR